ncbi:MAG: hypothetical protein R3E98_16995 [Gemmatimonadota bacterium]
MSVPALLRGVLLGGLAVLGLLLLREPGAGVPRTLLLERPEAARVAGALLAPAPPTRIRWSGATAPDAAALALLAPGPAVPPLTLPVGPPRTVSLVAPDRPRAGRAAALAATVHGAPGETVWLHFTEGPGAVDSVDVPIGPEGVGRVGLQVRPAREGWQGWSAWSGRDTAAVGAWVGPARPVRVLARTGEPGWESRFALRALDEAGAEVDARVELGRVDIPADGPQELAAYDVVLLLGDVRPDAALIESLRSFVASGGGVLLAPGLDGRRPSPGLTALLTGWGLGDSLGVGIPLPVGAAPGWALPAELSPLPAAPVRSGLVTLAGDVSASVAATDSAGRPVAAVAQVGRGRVGFLGLPETWRWRMEGGAVEAHRAWWRGWVEWAAGGLPTPLRLVGPDGPVLPGTPVRIEVRPLEAGARLPATLEVEAPDGRVVQVPVIAGVGGAGAEPYDVQPGVARFLAAVPGLWRVDGPGGPIGVAVVETPGAADPADVALTAIASGRADAPGIPVAPGNASGPAPVSEVPWRPAEQPRLPLAAGALLALVVAVEWTMRRRAGGP